MPSVRARGQLLPLVGVVALVLFTLGNAAANLIPVHRPTAADLRAEEQRDLVEQRRVRLAVLRSGGTACDAAHAHELARLLVMDGQFAEVRAFGASYEQRCGDDPVVRHWSLAPAPRARR
ncbi:MAG: hypothetical protein IPQ07_18510 [Myxococcales bacterium]|nr:hypothetical protein [Myxococcales bacterium]